MDCCQQLAIGREGQVLDFLRVTQETMAEPPILCVPDLHLRTGEIILACVVDPGGHSQTGGIRGKNNGERPVVNACGVYKMSTLYLKNLDFVLSLGPLPPNRMSSEETPIW
jgi:hypothetical protein